MDLELFIGRFHPLIVHLPIGFLLLAAIIQALVIYRREQFEKMEPAISFILLCGALSAIGAVFVGWLLASGGGYNPDTLFWHKWMGIMLALVSILAWLIKIDVLSLSQKVFNACLIAIVGLMGFTGHLGGNLTHGSDYLLAYAPEFVQKLAGGDGQSKVVEIPTSPDSVAVFEHLIKPALEAKCYECHNDDKKKGGLLLTTEEGILDGGDSGDNILVGHPEDSELFRRVTLPQSSKKFMPPKGNPLTYSELKLIEWWINEGASFENKLTDIEAPKEIKGLLMRDYDLDTRPKPLYEILTADQISEENKEEISKAGFTAVQLANNNQLLDVRTNSKEVSVDNVKALLKAKEQITWLSLGNKNISNDMLSTIGQLPKLTRLKLQQNPIDDEGMDKIADLKYLESLNLYGTKVGDKSLETLAKLPALKRLYLWQTNVTEDAVNELKKSRPDLMVDLGY
ncbi:MAG: hypothetical protein JXQ96_22775 [Cyclobacteriaceae bacterium]